MIRLNLSHTHTYTHTSLRHLRLGRHPQCWSVSEHRMSHPGVAHLRGLHVLMAPDLQVGNPVTLPVYLPEHQYQQGEIILLSLCW